MIAVLSVLTVVGLGYVLLFTSTVSVASVEVSGLKRLDDEAVLERAKIVRGHPMLRVDTDAAEQRIAKLAHIDRVSVSRSWPSTVKIEITERRPVAYFDAHDGLRLVDAAGVPFHEVGKAPKKLPELKVRTVAASDPETRAAMRVLGVIDDKLRKRVRAVEAKTPGSVQLRLTKGKVVRWGDAQQAERKTKVLAALLTRPGKYYDVSSPELPTVK